MDVFWAVILGLTLIPVFRTVAGVIRDEQETRHIRGACPACKHPEHWPWCKVIICPESRKPCWCDLFTEPSE